MGFLDEVVVTVRSGNGGRGCVSFRREKYVAKGGPDGGDGGDGGNAVAKATKELFSLTDYRSRRLFKAGNGEPGRGKNRSGKNGLDIRLEVPLGTMLYDEDTGQLLADLVKDQQEVLLAAGGKGGKGNQHFATSTNRTPRFAQPGTPGQEKKIRISLKFIADVGLVGLPNAGKSTLLSRLTMARPKIQDYPFTTLYPNLGMMGHDDVNSLVIADIPGLIEGASLGRGLGHRFLKHIERTTLLLHLLDVTYTHEKDVLEDYHVLREEMAAFSPVLIKKPHVVAINKMDLHGPGTRDVSALQKALEDLDVFSIAISAKTGKGLDELKEVICSQIDQMC
jgi:GTP-binding protein